jgi:hypothetical protein
MTRPEELRGLVQERLKGRTCLASESMAPPCKATLLREAGRRC